MLSVLASKQTFVTASGMSALPPKADIGRRAGDVASAVRATQA
jgi:hypothetical protein